MRDISERLTVSHDVPRGPGEVEEDQDPVSGLAVPGKGDGVRLRQWSCRADPSVVARRGLCGNWMCNAPLNGFQRASEVKSRSRWWSTTRHSSSASSIRISRASGRCGYGAGLGQHRPDLDKARGPEPGAIPCPGPRGLGSYLASPTSGDQFTTVRGSV
jgi:hypothetical protein